MENTQNTDRTWSNGKGHSGWGKFLEILGNLEEIPVILKGAQP